MAIRVLTGQRPLRHPRTRALPNHRFSHRRRRRARLPAPAPGARSSGAGEHTTAPKSPTGGKKEPPMIGGSFARICPRFAQRGCWSASRAAQVVMPLRGAGRNRTGEWEFCRLLPYHLATAPKSLQSSAIATSAQARFRVPSRGLSEIRTPESGHPTSLPLSVVSNGQAHLCAAGILTVPGAYP